MPKEQCPGQGATGEANRPRYQTYEAAELGLAEEKGGIGRIETGIERLLNGGKIDALVVETVVVAVQQNACNNEADQQEQCTWGEADGRVGSAARTGHIHSEAITVSARPGGAGSARACASLCLLRHPFKMRDRTFTLRWSRAPRPSGTGWTSFPRARGIPLKAREYLYLSLLTAGAFLVHGYHPYAEDAEFYVSAVKKLLNPSLYPIGAEIFARQTAFSLMPRVIATIVHTLHLPLETVLLAGHLLSYFLFLLGCWELSCLLFGSAPARWSAVALVAALLTIPVAATALFLMDQYLNPRSFSSVTTLFAVGAALEKRYGRVVVWLLITGLIHPLMMVFAAAFILLLGTGDSLQRKAALGGVLPGIGYLFQPPSEAYHRAAVSHSYYYVTQWAWYEWLGAIIPVALFFWFWRIARTRRMTNIERLCPVLIAWVLLSLAASFVLDVPHRFEVLAGLQPMRSLHLAYVFLFLMAGGLAAEFAAKRVVWLWLLVLLPLASGMAYVQIRLFPVSAHVEWPGSSARNRWVQAFLWIRQNTPTDAYFALDPAYMRSPGEELQAFLPVAERSAMPDAVKDSGAVTLFPDLAPKWWEQVSALRAWRTFQLSDFQEVGGRFGVGWVVVEQPGVQGLECPYENQAVKVCRVPRAMGTKPISPPPGTVARGANQW